PGPRPRPSPSRRWPGTRPGSSGASSSPSTGRRPTSTTGTSSASAAAEPRGRRRPARPAVAPPRAALHYVGVAPGEGSSTRRTAPPAVGATLIAASIVVLVIGLSWLNRGGDGRERLAVPVVGGVTPPTEPDGDVVDIPPSQPAVPVSFGQDGRIVRPEPDRARIVDEEGNEVIVALPPGTTVDTVTGRIVPRSPRRRDDDLADPGHLDVDRRRQQLDPPDRRRHDDVDDERHVDRAARLVVHDRAADDHRAADDDRARAPALHGRRHHRPLTAPPPGCRAQAVRRPPERRI